MGYRMIRSDITSLQVDVIVNSANPEVAIGSGVDYAIYQKAGIQELFEERKRIGKLPIGKLGISAAYQLQAKYIFHISSPIYLDGKHHEMKQLKKCYEKCLIEAIRLNCHSIAFPVLGIGNDSFPKMDGILLAIECFETFLKKYDLDILFVLYDQKAYQIAKGLQLEIKSYIDEHYIQMQELLYSSSIKETRGSPLLNRRRNQKNSVSYVELEDSLIEPFLQVGKTFQEKLFEWIDLKGYKDVEIYNQAMITKQVFSSIRKNVHYKPSKKTAFGLCVALHLNFEQSCDLLSRANLAFSPSEKFDLIVEYYIKHQVYDLSIINETLYEYHLDTFGIY